MLAIRVNSDGSLDGGFGTGGVWYLEGATESDFSSASDCLSMPDGSLVLAGSRAGIALARLRPDGVLDTAYWNSGITRIDLDGDSEVRSIVLLDSGGLGVVASQRARCYWSWRSRVPRSGCFLCSNRSRDRVARSGLRWSRCDHCRLRPRGSGGAGRARRTDSTGRWQAGRGRSRLVLRCLARAGMVGFQLRAVVHCARARRSQRRR